MPIGWEMFNRFLSQDFNRFLSQDLPTIIPPLTKEQAHSTYLSSLYIYLEAEGAEYS